jgi:septum formation protein
MYSGTVDRTKIYLASTSPRRRQLLSDIGFEFEIVNPDIDEIERKGESPRSMVRRFAAEKADAARRKLVSASGILIAADTTVVSPDRKHILNKPTSKSRAEKILRTISGKTHVVLTGYVIDALKGGKITRRHISVVHTSVTMRKLSPDTIADYVAHGEPMDKAGAYGAQGIGMSLIESIRGSYSNVIGLPMAELVVDLEKKFETRPKWRTPG